MKKFILFFALFAMCLGAKAQWENIRNAGSQIYYTDIQFCNINTGYVVGYDGSETWVNKGIVEKTIDGGNSWERIYVGYDIAIQSVSFQSLDTGYICGYHGKIPQTADSTYSMVIKTVDGGSTWFPFLTSSQIDPNTFRQVRFFSENNGVIISNQGTYYTTDGGVSWDFLQGIWGSVGMLNENVGMIGKYLFHFEETELIIDEEIALDDNTAYGMCDINMIDTHTFFYDFPERSESVYKYTNGYTEVLLTAQPMFYYTGVYFVNPNVGFVGGTGLYRTDDGGRTWGEYFPIDAIKFFFIDENNGFALTEGRLYKTTTGGLVVKKEYRTSNKEIQVFSNPAVSDLTVDLSAFDIVDNYHYDIVNATGSVVISGDSKSAVFDINIQRLQKGVYFIRIENLNVTSKFIKE